MTPDGGKKKILEAVGQSSDENIQQVFVFFFPFFVLVNCFQAKTIKKQ